MPWVKSLQGRQARSLTCLEKSNRNLPSWWRARRAYAGLSAEQIYARLHDADGEGDAAAPGTGRRSALDGDDNPHGDGVGDDGSGVLVEPGLDLTDPNDPWALALSPPPSTRTRNSCETW